MERSEQRAYIERACAELGVTIEELADKLQYKSLRRAYWGELPLQDSRIKHIEDLLRMHRMARGVATETVAPSAALMGKKIPQRTPGDEFSRVRVLPHLPLETLKNVARELLSAELEKIDFPALREIIDELNRREYELRVKIATQQDETSKPPTNEPPAR